MRNYLVQLNRTRGITIVISSHVLDQLERMCTHYGVIANGRMVRQMTAEQVQHECGESLRVRTADPSRTLALLEDASLGDGVRFAAEPDGSIVVSGGFDPARVSALLHQTGQEVLMSARLGRFPYFMGKLAAVMAVTAAVFTLPFLIEILLNCIAFPLNAQGDLTNWDAYDPDYVASVKHYLCYPLYLFSPYLYAVCGTLLFGLMSGVLGGFVVTFSALFPIKYSVVLFLPAFLLLNATVYFSQIQTVPFQSGWYHYFLLFDDTVKSPLYLIAGLLLLLIVSIAGCVWGGKQDCLR